jgi:hypothetical protein
LVSFLFEGGVFLLEACGVAEDDGGEIDGRLGGEDGLGEAFLNEPGEEAGVIEVGVGQEQVVDGVGPDGAGGPIALEAAAFLKEAAIDHDAEAAGFEEVA